MSQATIWSGAPGPQDTTTQRRRGRERGSLSTISRVMLRELATKQAQAARIPEPMFMRKNTVDFNAAGKDDGIMAAPNLYHIAQICQAVSPGGLVVDLGCGPANLLTKVAGLNPESRFLGLDGAPEMLEDARRNIEDEGLENVEVRQENFTDLTSLGDASVDTMISTMTLHHLDDEALLEQTFREIARVLKPNGGLYITDFGRLKSPQSMTDMAYMHANRQTDFFTEDYLNSMRAAFTREDFVGLSERYLDTSVQFRTTFLVPHLLAIKRTLRNRLPNETVSALGAMRRKLDPLQRRDLKEIEGFFRLGRLRSALP